MSIWRPQLSLQLLHPACTCLQLCSGCVQHLQGSKSEAIGAPLGLHDALAAAAFQQGSVLDLDLEEYRESTGGGIPRVLHQVFLDGEEEYARCAA